MTKKRKEFVLAEIRHNLNLFAQQGGASGNTATYLNAANAVNSIIVELSGISSFDDIDDERLNEINIKLRKILNNLGVSTVVIEKTKASI